MNNTNIPRMRTIPEAAKQLRADGIEIGEYRLREWCRERAFPSVRAGRKTLINYDRLLAFLAGDDEEKEDKL